MDQRVKGGSPPTTASTLDSTCAPEDSEQDQVAEKKRRGEGERGDVGKKEEEKRGVGKKREGDKGAVLELLIEGRCGGVGQQQLQISGSETSCPEGNVRVRIGLQTKRTKKPPKILESYVCKPTIRTYQRQSRGALVRGDGDGGATQPGKTISAPEEANRELHSGLDGGQATSKQTASSASPPLTSSSSSSSQLLSSSTFTTASTAASVPAVTSQKSAKQAPVKLADKTEVNSNGSLEKVKKDKLPSVNGQPVPAGPKPSSSTSDRTASAAPSAPSIHTASALEPRNEGNTSKKHNGLVQTAKHRRLSNGKSSASILGTSTASKNKVGKNSSFSSVSSSDTSARLPVFSSAHKEFTISSRSKSDSPSYSPVNPKPQSSGSPAADLSSTQSQGQDPSLQPSFDKKREREKKAKKDKRKEKKAKRERLEAEAAKSESRKDEVKKKKKEKGKDGKAKHSREKDEGHKAENLWSDELKSARGKAEKKRDKLSPDTHRTEENIGKCGEATDNAKGEKLCKVVNPGKGDEKEKTDDSCKPVKQAEPATLTGDTSKSKEQDVSRHSAASPSHPSPAAPPSLPLPAAHAPISPPSSPQEQDSRPLKKRKARRPSWTKLAHRAQRAENQEAPSDSSHNPGASFPQNSKMPQQAKTTAQLCEESHQAPSSSSASGSSPLSSATKPAVPKQNHPSSDAGPPAPRPTTVAVRKRGRPKSHSSSVDETPPRLSPKDFPTEVALRGCDGGQKAPVLEPGPGLQCATQTKPAPKKRGRPPKRAFPEEHADPTESSKNFHPSEKGNRQLKIRRLINEMKKRKKRRLHKALLSAYVGKAGRGAEAADGETSLRMCKSIDATTVHTLSALSSSFGSKLGPQINVSKRGTIYMGKRRGRKPKSQTANLTSSSQIVTPSSLFTNLPETSLFSTSKPQPPPSHPFPSPSLTHSSGAQSPYSEGSLTEPTSSLLFSQPFSLPSPSSSCTSPRPPSSSSLSPFVKKSCPCQGRHHFPFHQSSCKLSSLTPPLHHTPGSPGHLKEATPSPRSESHSEETLPSDSGIGTDNNSVSERGELRGARSMLRLGHGPEMIHVGQRHVLSFGDRPSPVSSPLSCLPRHANPATNSSALERHRDRERHRHRRRDYDCPPSSCACLCPCPCPGHNKCTHSDYYSCLGHDALKRQKNKHKKKHQQLHMQDPEFLAELEDLIGQFSEVHIGRRSWVRPGGATQGFEGSPSAGGGRRHHSSSHSLRSNIFRINLNGFYSPHPSSFPANPSYPSQSFYPCHCSRKPDRRQCGCPSKFQETIESMGFYSSYPPATTLYHHLPSSYPLPSPHQYAPHQPHHAHFLLNPARFHRRRSRLLREGAFGGEVEGDLGGGGGGGPHLSSGVASGLSCGCGRSDHKHKHKHRHRHCDRDMEEEEDMHEDEEEDGIERERLPCSKSRSTFILGPGEGGRKSARGARSMLSKESPWLCKNRNDSLSGTASSSSSSSSAAAADRYKHTSLTSLGLGSSHLSSFGGGWGGLGQTWTKFRGLGGMGFGNLNPSWRGFTTDQRAGGPVASDGEDEDGEDVEEPPVYRTPPSPTHANLFTSAAIATGGRGLRSGLASRNTGGGERSWRRDELARAERRDAAAAGLQGDSRSRGQQKSVPTPDGVAVQNKRRPGRPRKHPLPPPAPATVPPPTPTPTRSSAAPFVSPPPDLLPGQVYGRDGREVAGRREERVAERERGAGGGGGGGGGDTVQQVTESELQAKRKRGRKRKHGDSPSQQSAAEDKVACDALPEPLSQSDVEPAPAQPDTVQREERAAAPPWKKFLRAGLYSDDYKTTHPPSQAQKMCRESTEYKPGEHEYSLLPAPLHVGKYLRLKRIHFQLPYDVMWLWQHNQLHRQPAVPLRRKRRYCRLKERTASCQQAAEESSSDITSLFPHLDMEPLTSTERSFVMKHHVFLVRNWELMRDRQIRMRIERERERDAEGDEGDPQRRTCDGADGDDCHIKSDLPVGVEVTVMSSDPHHQSQDTSSSLTASPCLSKTQNRLEEEEEEEGGEEEKRGEGEACSREQRRKRLNDLLLTLQHS